jgi:hypothetical protein
MSTCDICPIPKANCPGRATPRLCWLVQWRDDYRNALAELADVPEPPLPAAGRTGRAIELDNDDPPSRPTIDQTRELRARMLACPHRQPHSCNCAQLATCTLGKGNAGTVDHHDCRDCLLAQDHDP